MSNKPPTMASKLYALAIAKDTANLIDMDAALALSRASVRTLVALSPQSALFAKSFAQEEVDRLHMDCTEESQGSIAMIMDAVSG